MTGFRTALRRDRILYATILGYVLGCGMLSLTLDSGGKFLPFMYLERWFVFLIALAVIHVVALRWQSLSTSAPVPAFRHSIAETLPQFSTGVLLCLALALVHGAYTSIKTIIPDVYPFRYDIPLAKLDAALHGGDPWRLLTWLNPVTDYLQPLYSVVWLLLVVLVTSIATTSTRLHAARSQYAWTFLLCWTLLGNILSSLTLAAGPAYYEKVTGSDRFNELTDYLSRHDGPFSAFNIQERLWAAYSEQTVGMASGISAFPSMHLSMATLFVLYAFRVRRIWGLVFAAYALIILLGSVHLGWHYAIDGYFSIFATIGIWKAVGWRLEGFPGLSGSDSKLAAAE